MMSFLAKRPKTADSKEEEDPASPPRIASPAQLPTARTPSVGELAQDPGFKAAWQRELGFTWEKAIGHELRRDWFSGKGQLLDKVALDRERYTVYPPHDLVFTAFKLTPLEKVRVVIVGQDPYHGPRQAMGLSFSVPLGVPVPPSLRNIYEEIGLPKDTPGDLTSWAQQGVFLLNTLLTVRQSEPLSHKDIGWAKFTDNVMHALNARVGPPLIFLLWGNPAKKKGAKLDRKKHHVLEAGHPSPLSKNLFMRCGHFAKVNELLTARGETPIEWNPTVAPPLVPDVAGAMAGGDQAPAVPDHGAVLASPSPGAEATVAEAASAPAAEATVAEAAPAPAAEAIVAEAARAPAAEATVAQAVPGPVDAASAPAAPRDSGGTVAGPGGHVDTHERENAPVNVEPSSGVKLPAATTATSAGVGVDLVRSESRLV